MLLCAKNKAKKLLEISWVKIFYHLPACIVESVSEHSFCFTQKNTHKQKTKETKENRKTTEIKEEKEKENAVFVNSICGKSNMIQWYHLQICSVYF